MIGQLFQNETLIRKIAEISSSNTEISKQGSSIPETKNYHKWNCEDLNSTIQKYTKVSKSVCKLFVKSVK